MGSPNRPTSGRLSIGLSSPITAFLSGGMALLSLLEGLRFFLGTGTALNPILCLLTASILGFLSWKGGLLSLELRSYVVMGIGLVTTLLSQDANPVGSLIVLLGILDGFETGCLSRNPLRKTVAICLIASATYIGRQWVLDPSALVLDLADAAILPAFVLLFVVRLYRSIIQPVQNLKARGLTGQEIVLARYLSGGQKYDTLATILGMKPAALRKAAAIIFRKFEVRNREELLSHPDIPVVGLRSKPPEQPEGPSWRKNLEANPVAAILSGYFFTVAGSTWIGAPEDPTWLVALGLGLGYAILFWGPWKRTDRFVSILSFVACGLFAFLSYPSISHVYLMTVCAIVDGLITGILNARDLPKTSLVLISSVFFLGLAGAWVDGALGPDLIVVGVESFLIGAMAAKGVLTHWTYPYQRRTTSISGVLTPIERSLLELASQGYSYKEIAGLRNLSEATVRVYFSRMFRTCEVSRRTELVKLFLEEKTVADRPFA